MTYVMSDLHGELDRYNAMLDLILFSDDDTLYVLGDVIDRNAHGIEILRDVMRRTNVHLILGNHEQMMLDSFWSPNEYDARRLWKQNGGGNTYRTMVYRTPTEERLRILRFVQELPDHVEIEVNGHHFYLVHGYVGETHFDRIWCRPEPPPAEPPLPGKTVVVGHTCTYYFNMLVDGYDENAPFEIFYAPGLIAIDCGCGNATDLRRLACLRLDDLKEFYI